MGDTGSNLLGYLLGGGRRPGRAEDERGRRPVLPAGRARRADPGHGFVVAKRIKYRQPIYRADRWHFHHRMANIGFSQRRTLAYLYGWALVMAGLALALRFVPYSDDHGHFDPVWTVVIAACLAAALAASFYLVVTLEILKLRALRAPRASVRAAGPPPRGRGRRGRRARARDGQLRGRQPGDRRVRGASTPRRASSRRSSAGAVRSRLDEHVRPTRAPPGSRGRSTGVIAAALVREFAAGGRRSLSPPSDQSLPGPEFETLMTEGPPTGRMPQQPAAVAGRRDGRVRGGRVRARLAGGPCRAARSDRPVRGPRRGNCPCLRSL